MQEFDGRRLDEVFAFLAVIDAGSFSHASRAAGRDASVLSRRVTALERRLGVRLIERTTRRLVLTEAGARFAERMRGALAAMAEAEAEATDAAGNPRGTLRLAAPGAFGRMWIAPMLPDFLSAHPGVRLDVSYSERYVDLVAEGYDLAIRIGELADSRLIARKLVHNRRLVCAAPAYLAGHGVPAAPADLAGHNCLQFTRLASFPEWRFRRNGQVEGVKVSGNLDADDARSLVWAGVAGHGVIICSEWLVGPELADGRLVEILGDWSVDGEGAIYLVRPSARFTAGKVRAFSEWLAGRMSPPPWSGQG